MTDARHDRERRDGDDLPDEVRRALEQLPPGFEDALDQAPQEVRDALSGFQEGTSAEVEGVDLESALAGTPIDAANVLGQLPNGLVEGVEGIEVADGGALGFATARVSGGPEHKLGVRFDRDAYGPGDVVEGTIVAHQRVKARELVVELGYVERSPNYVEHTVHDSAGTLRKGHLDPGSEVRFALRIPPGALPNWDPAGVSGALAGGGWAGLGSSAAGLGLAGYGGLHWAVVTTATRRGVVAHTVERHPVPLVDDTAVWLGPDPGEAPPPVEAAVKGWDVEVEVDPWAPRRGEEVVLDLAIKEPAPGRDVHAGLVCEIHYDVETSSTDSDGHSTTSRSTSVATAHEQWVPVDASTTRQRVSLRVPADAPFSHGEPRAKALAGGRLMFSRSKLRHDSAFSAVWKAVVREHKRGRRDPNRSARLQVLP